uniref:SH3 domain-containing protein n=1 Tax=Caenorhabditis tropicalis TaxID=1561998 RepID=A0A1I7TZX1_9PELO
MWRGVLRPKGHFYNLVVSAGIFNIFGRRPSLMGMKVWTWRISHRYPPAIPMSVDEQAVPPEISPSMAAKIPELVHEQLANQFLPAAKNLGQAGMHLLKTYYMFQEALSSYCDATHKLIMSADTAGHKSKNEARELSKVFKQFVQGVNAHQKVITEFDALAHKVHDYSNKEKEKLKAEYSEYKAKEKKLMKRKSGETEQDIVAFHRKEAAGWSKQQELRYKFFHEKLQSWINGYVEIGKLFQPELTAQPVVGGVVAAIEVPVKQENHADWHHELHEDAAVVIAKEAQEKAENVVVDQAVQDSRSNSTSSVATTLEELPRRTTNDMTGVTLVSSHRRQSIEIQPVPPVSQRPPPITTYTAPPALPPKPIEQQYSPVRQPLPSARHDEDAYAHRHHADQVPQQPINSAPGARRAGSSIPGAVNVFGFANQSNAQPNVRYTPVQNGAPYQVVTREHIRVGRVVDNPVTEEQMNAKKFHVDSTYVPMASPSHQSQQHSQNGSADISVPSYFNPSQYGSILIVNDDFNASSGEQMTVNRGDKVILLKCGNRGWVFVRDSISNRTGWVPEPYVSL